MTREIMEEKKRKRRYERKWRISKRMEDRECFKAQKRKYDKLLKESHTKYLSDLILDNSNDPRSLFRLINKMLSSSKDNILPDHQSEDELVERFKVYFTEKVSAIHANLKISGTTSNSYSAEEIRKYQVALTDFREITEDEVGRTIQKSPKKSCSLDPMPTWLLNKCKTTFTPTTTLIVNSSINLAFVPELLKSAVITPFLKKRNLPPVLKNFRPVSNLKYLSKLIERVISSQLHEHLIKNNILEPMQSAYRRRHSTETALVKVQNDILLAMDNGNVTMLLLLDLSAAFDTVSHSILINRLEKRVGIKGKALDWFKSYLGDRKQCVSINKTKSKPCALKFGVPQGSVLGPILFSLYTLPLADILKKRGISYHLYADDTQLYMSFWPTNNNENNVCETLSNCVVEIKNWMTENLLQLNTDKTELNIFGTRQMLLNVANTDFNIAGDSIEVTSCTKNLGVIFDNTMNMNDHISLICRKSFNEIRSISTIRKYLTLDATKSIVQALVCSRVDFNNSLYYGLPQKQIQRLQRIQNCAARLIFNKRKFDHITPSLIELHWLPVHARITFKLLVLTYKCLNDLAPSYLKSLLLPKSETIFKLRSTCNPYLLKTPASRLVYGGDRAFSTAATFEWNKLPIEIQSSESIEIFKRKLKTHLFKKAYR